MVRNGLKNGAGAFFSLLLLLRRFGMMVKYQPVLMCTHILQKYIMSVLVRCSAVQCITITMQHEEPNK